MRPGKLHGEMNRPPRHISHVSYASLQAYQATYLEISPSHNIKDNKASN